MSHIQVNNVWKSYEQRHSKTVVLEDLNLEIDNGQFVTIIGASGCGKTTFLRLLLGEEIPSRGTITIDGERLVAEPSAERGIVFQRYSVFPHLTVLQNVLLGLELGASKFWWRSYGQQRQRQVQQCCELLEKVGLTAAQDQYPGQLSGGMQQRLAICQALVVEPKVLLLDEPFGALDPGIRSDMHQLVSQLHQDLKLTVLMITHDINEGFHLGTRLLVFDKTRDDPHDPNAYGSRVTYDLPLKDWNSTHATH